MTNLRTMLEHPGYRYVIIGGSVYVFELLVILFAQTLGCSAVWAVAMSFCLGTIVSFFLQKLITFNDKRMQHHILIPQLIATTLLIAWNLGFSVLLTCVLQHHLPPVITRTIALGITTIWNFYLYKTRIFKSNEEILID